MKEGQNKFETHRRNFFCYTADSSELLELSLPQDFLMLDNIIGFRKGLNRLLDNRFLNRKRENVYTTTVVNAQGKNKGKNSRKWPGSCDLTKQCHLLQPSETESWGEWFLCLIQAWKSRTCFMFLCSVLKQFFSFYQDTCQLQKHLKM